MLDDDECGVEVNADAGYDDNCDGMAEDPEIEVKLLPTLLVPPLVMLRLALLLLLLLLLLSFISHACEIEEKLRRRSGGRRRTNLINGAHNGELNRSQLPIRALSTNVVIRTFERKQHSLRSGPTPCQLPPTRWPTRAVTLKAAERRTLGVPPAVNRGASPPTGMSNRSLSFVRTPFSAHPSCSSIKR
jgi:hypothetical protein